MGPWPPSPESHEGRLLTCVGLGVAAVVAGFAVFTGRGWARWLGVAVAGLNAIAQLMFAQAYPLWSLMIMSVDILVIYGLTAYGSQIAAIERAGSQETGRERQGVAQRSETFHDAADEESRAA